MQKQNKYKTARLMHAGTYTGTVAVGVNRENRAIFPTSCASSTKPFFASFWNSPSNRWFVFGLTERNAVIVFLASLNFHSFSNRRSRCWRSHYCRLGWASFITHQKQSAACQRNREKVSKVGLSSAVFTQSGRSTHSTWHLWAEPAR